MLTLVALLLVTQTGCLTSRMWIEVDRGALESPEVFVEAASEGAARVWVSYEPWYGSKERVAYVYELPAEDLARLSWRGASSGDAQAAFRAAAHECVQAAAGYQFPPYLHSRPDSRRRDDGVSWISTESLFGKTPAKDAYICAIVLERPNSPGGPVVKDVNHHPVPLSPGTLFIALPRTQPHPHRNPKLDRFIATVLTPVCLVLDSVHVSIQSLVWVWHYYL
jgi:hypothetical protein